MPGPEKDPFKNPTPGGSKRTASSQPPPPRRSATSSSSSSEEDATKTPKKARRSTVAAQRNKALWSHFKLDPKIPKEQQNKNTKVRVKCTVTDCKV